MPLQKCLVARRETQKLVYFRFLAQATLESHFAQTYSLIFGSQILGLRRLNERGQVTLADAESFYNQYKAAFPQFYTNFPFQAWLNYLTRADFVTR